MFVVVKCLLVSELRGCWRVEMEGHNMSYPGGKAWWVGFCVGVGLLAVLCPQAYCAVKRGCLACSAMQYCLARFPS